MDISDSNLSKQRSLAVLLDLFLHICSACVSFSQLIEPPSQSALENELNFVFDPFIPSRAADRRGLV